MYYIIIFLAIFNSCRKSTFSPSRPEDYTSFEHFLSGNKNYFKNRYYTKGNVNYIKNEEKDEVYIKSKQNIENSENQIVSSYVNMYNDIAKSNQIKYEEKDLKNSAKFNIKKYPDGNMTMAAIIVKKNITPIPTYLNDSFERYKDYKKKNEKTKKKNEEIMAEITSENWNQSYNSDTSYKAEYRERIFRD